MEQREQAASGAGATRSLLTLVIPTRNEAATVGRLVRELEESLAGVAYRIIFVDDSTDETPKLIRALGEEDDRVVLIHREGAERGGGLSTAVTTGLDAVSKESEYTCVMDADLQHPPGKVREMLEEAAGSGADVVVASRYVEGGDYSGLSGPVRRAVSVGSKYLAQVVFREARKTTDPMTGFFLVRNEAISGIQFRPTGFKVLLEILVCAPELKVVEVPLNFRARHAGVSKASLRQGMEYLAHMASLFWYVPSAGRFWKFTLVGASGVLVNMLTFAALVTLVNANQVIAWMFGVGLSILSNYLLNSAFTWRDVRHASRIHFFLRGALAYPVAIVGIGANFAVFYSLLKYVSGDFPLSLLFNFLGIVAATSVNFALSSRLVFRPSVPKSLNLKAPPEQIAAEIREELKADQVRLIRASDLQTIAVSADPTVPLPRPLTAADESNVDLVLRTVQPTLLVTGPRRLPQARTNARRASSLAVPVLRADRPVGVAYATRYAVEQFAEEDLHWLTAYATTAAPIFD